MSARDDFSNKMDSTNTLENYPTLTFVEIDLIIELVREDGKKMSDGAEASRNNYRQIRAAYATVLLALAQLEGALDKARNNALEKLNKVDTVKLSGNKLNLNLEKNKWNTLSSKFMAVLPTW